jgi:pimeloyl-ACP methyl ester carboxylesterase
MHRSHAALIALLLASAACVSVRGTDAPMATRAIGRVGPVGTAGVAPAASAKSPSRCLIVFLPGRRDHLGDFEKHRFPEMAQRAGVAADFLEADAHLGFYLAETISKRLHTDVIAPAAARGAEKIWIVGVSMGGLGGILYAREHPEGARGVVALAPFLGDQEPRLVAAAGGLRSYAMGAPRRVADYERELWGWLKRYAAAGADRPPIWVGLGIEDDLAAADRLLGDALPPGRTFEQKGGHDWKTWTRLWQQVLDAGMLQKDCGR